jgi:integrase/recombinase XerD
MSGGTLRKRGKIYWARVRFQGKDHEKSLGTESRTVARERLGRYVEELKAAKWGEKPRRKFDEALERFIAEHMPLKRPGTYKRYSSSIKHLVLAFEGAYLDELGSERLYRYEMERRKSVQTPTIRRDLACLRTIFSCAETWEWASVNPVKAYLRGRASSLTENPPRNRVLSHQEEANLLASAEEWVRQSRSDGGHPVPWPVIIPVAIDTGLRRDELFGLERGTQLRLEQSEIFIPSDRTKAGRDRRIPILDRSRSLLEGHPAFLGRPWVFYRGDGNRYARTSPYVWESFQKICRHAGVKDFTIHDLRRTCGCRLLQDRRMSMEEVSKWLGHSSIKVTERVYAFLDVEHLHQAVKRTSANIVQLPEGTRRGTERRGFSNKTVAGQRVSS